MKTLEDVYKGKIYADQDVLAAAPRNKRQAELNFFKLSRYVTEEELEKEYADRGLVPADVFALGAWCEENKDDARKYFATHWKDADGNWCYAAFDSWSDGRDVSVYRSAVDWSDYWWFAAI